MSLSFTRFGKEQPPGFGETPRLLRLNAAIQSLSISDYIRQACASICEEARWGKSCSGSSPASAQT